MSKQAPPPSSAPIELDRLTELYDIIGELGGAGRDAERREHDNDRTLIGTRRSDGTAVLIAITAQPEGDAGNALSHLAADANLLASLAHRALLPVLDAQWLGDAAFAVISQRPTFPSLAATIAREQLPYVRIAAILREVNAVIEWARDKGIVHRLATTDTVFVEPNSDRTLVTFTSAALPANGSPGRASDAGTIARLAEQMIGERDDVARRLSEETDAIRDASSERGATPDVHTYIALVAMADAVKRGEDHSAETAIALEKLRQEFNAKIEAERAEHERVMADQRKELQRQGEQQEKALADQRKEMERQHEEFEKALAQQRKELEKHHEQRVRELEKRGDEQEKALSARKRALERQLQQQQKALAKERKQLEREMSKEREPLRRSDTEVEVPITNGFAGLDDMASSVPADHASHSFETDEIVDEPEQTFHAAHDATDFATPLAIGATLLGAGTHAAATEREVRPPMRAHESDASESDASVSDANVSDANVSDARAGLARAASSSRGAEKPSPDRAAWADTSSWLSTNRPTRREPLVKRAWVMPALMVMLAFVLAASVVVYARHRHPTRALASLTDSSTVDSAAGNVAPYGYFAPLTGTDSLLRIQRNDATAFGTVPTDTAAADSAAASASDSIALVTHRKALSTTDSARTDSARSASPSSATDSAAAATSVTPSLRDTSSARMSPAAATTSPTSIDSSPKQKPSQTRDTSAGARDTSRPAAPKPDTTAKRDTTGH